MSDQPDLDRDVIVKHRKAADGERWEIFLGTIQRAELPTAQGALLFARLLADLQQRRAWVRHMDGEINPLDSSALTGCSCC